jgi:hypothetical protein
MIYQIGGHGWPLGGGAWLAPPGTVIDAVNGTDTFSLLARGLPLPINVQALDDEACEALKQLYPDHLLGPPPPVTSK